MATPATLKKIEEKKLMAQKRKENQDGSTQLLSLSSQSNAPSSHLLVRTEPVEGAPPRHIDMRPLSSYTNYRERKEDFSADVTDRPYGLLHYTNFASEFGSVPLQTAASSAFAQPYLHNQPLQPLTRPGGYNQYGQYRRPVKTNKQQQLTVVPIPDEMPAWKLTVHPDKLVCFHGKTSFLAQLHSIQFLVDGNEYQSVEHYYQACKLFSLAGAEAAQELRVIKDPMKAKNRARELLFRLGISNDKVEHWKSTHGVLILQHAMRHKFARPEMRDLLLATGDHLLVQAYDRDTFYAAGMQEAGVREWAKKNEGKVLKFPVQLTHENVKYLPLVGKGKNVLGALAMQMRNELRGVESPEVLQVPGSAAAGLPLSSSEASDTIHREQQLSPGLANAMNRLVMSGDDDDDGANSTSGGSAGSRTSSIRTEEQQRGNNASGDGKGSTPN